ncbi:MAG: glycoside hydrolase domain-containing protein, partial [Solirubrobacteraceae bacterium]
MHLPSFAHTRRPPRSLWAVLTALALALAAVPAATLPATALAAAGHRFVRYHGYRIEVPSGWPVLRLSSDRSACVRFDRHAVYLGVPGSDQRCPAAATGRTEAILVSPLGARTEAMLPRTTTR